jgi:DNA-binding HxlR family transcriptional regulator
MTESCLVKELNGRKYRCFFELTLLVIGGKWKPIILWHLSQGGVMRFGELRRSIPDVTERMLTRQLRELASDGLVHREVYRVVPPKVEYSLTEMGQSLIHILQEMRDWGVTYEEYVNGGEVLSGDGFEKKERLTYW